MKKTLVLTVSCLLLLSSCGSYEAAGAYTGSQFGSILGSAIGGIAGGPRGSDIGTIVGMAGGAVVGGAVGKSADRKAERQYEERMQQRTRQQSTRRMQTPQAIADDSGFDPTNSGDDRIAFGDASAPAGAGMSLAGAANSLEIRNARIVDQNKDGALSRGETVRMVFEIFNRSSQTAYNVQPCVAETTGNKHIYVSQNILVERILPHQGIRYTATVTADNRLKDGEAVLRIGVLQNRRELTSQSRDFRLVTSKR